MAIRDVLKHQTKGDNAGLLIARYLSEHDNAHKGQSDLYAAAVDALSSAMPLYAMSYARWKNGLPASKDLQARGRIVIGLGNENVLEAGVSLNHIYGAPYIPGSSLKGLAWHYCNTIWGQNEPKFKKGGEYHSILFGTDKAAGFIVFSDAWITPDTLPGSLVRDVMTPHHSDYYSGKKAPSEYDDPSPVHFLSVKGNFTVPLSCEAEGEEGAKWRELAYKLLGEALENWGIGGKTSSGYGRMMP